MFSFRVDAKKFTADMAIAKLRFARNVMSALDRASRQAADWAKTTRLYKNRTWALTKSIGSDVQANFRAKTFAKAKHAVFVENGINKEYRIPKKSGGKILKFQHNGQTIFRRSVVHKGTKPRPFMQRARDKVEPLFERLCREAVDRLF